jgi:CBS domain-containing protein
MLVKEVMTRNIECVDVGACLSDIAGKMRKRGVDCLPVEDCGRLVGTISDRDITERAVARGRDPARTPAAKVMSKGFAWCFDDDATDSAVRIMEKKRTRRLVVLDHHEQMVGILALGDLALGAARAFTSDMMVAAYDDYYGWSRRG